MGRTKTGIPRSSEVSNPQEQNPLLNNKAKEQEQIPVNHDDAWVTIEMNKFKYTDVPVNPELMQLLSQE